MNSINFCLITNECHFYIEEKKIIARMECLTILAKILIKKKNSLRIDTKQFSNFASLWWKYLKIDAMSQRNPRDVLKFGHGTKLTSLEKFKSCIDSFKNLSWKLYWHARVQYKKKRIGCRIAKQEMWHTSATATYGVRGCLLLTGWSLI